MSNSNRLIEKRVVSYGLARSGVSGSPMEEMVTVLEPVDSDSL